MSQFETKKMNKLFEEYYEALLAMDKDSLLSSKVVRGKAHELTLFLVPNIIKLFDMMPSVFSDAYTQELRESAEELPNLVLVFYAADLKNENSWTEEQQKLKKELAAKVRGHDKFMFKCLWLLFENHPELEPTLTDIKKRSGHRDNADDVIRMSGIGQENWDDIVGKSPLTLEYIEQAEADANEFIKLLDISSPEAPTSPNQMKRRAYTKWHRTYKELCLAGRFLVRHQKDGKKQFPGVH